MGRSISKNHRFVIAGRASASIFRLNKQRCPMRVVCCKGSEAYLGERKNKTPGSIVGEGVSASKTC
ncbi:hypothetical protein B0O80DRAFT_472880 [Mortierella sp. GBAus27b]|nr:hypothetical protein B0O80DRAFT_472880 [Mortierella sp. GBAus27b]